MTPTISVVIPVFNRPWELARALDSLTAQSDSDFEVLVCDDGSEVDMSAVIAPYRNRLQLTYERIENSGGPARPRNLGIQLAKGEWIAFLDSDDWWDENRIAVIKEHLSDVDFIYHPLRVVRENKESKGRERRTVIGEPMMGNPLHHLLIYGNPVPNSAVLVRRKWLLDIGGIDEDPRVIEDFDAWIRLMAAGARVRFVEKPLGAYWVGMDNISILSRRQVDQQVEMFERYVHLLPSDVRSVAVACHHYRIGSLLSQLGAEPHRARDHFAKARGLPTLDLRIKRLIKLAMSHNKF